MLDADVIIHAEKGKFNLQEWVAARSDDQLAVAAITVAELWHGVERATGKQRLVRRHFLQAALKRLPVFPYSERTAYLHATLWAHLQEKGAMIGDYDLIVAATAQERKYSLATFNVKHFNKVPNLRIVVPK